MTRAGVTGRIQLQRRAGWRKPAGAVVVARPTRWGNPYAVGEYGREEAVRLYRAYLRDHPEIVEAVRRELAGRDLACWCRLTDEQGRRVPCHADVLLQVAAGGAP